jgi:hypothetical protein
MSLTRSPSHTTTAHGTGRRAAATRHTSARRLDSRVVFDGVVASYLHDISQRRRRSGPVPEGHSRRTSE